MNSSHDDEQARVTQQAAEWFVANRDGLDAGQRARFEEWLNASPASVEEYIGVARLVQDLPAAVADDPELSIAALLERAGVGEAPNVRPLERMVDPAPAMAPRRGWLFAAAASMAGIVAVGVLLWTGQRQPPAPVIAQRYATGHGQQLTQRLEDDSVLHLNTDTAVSVRYQRGVRLIAIERGQVLFEAAHDPSRPFRVIAGSAQIEDIGTRFDVYLQPDATVVTVVEGRVMVGRSPEWGGSATAADGRTLAMPIYLDAGQQVRVARGQVPATATMVDPGAATAWLRHQITFEREPLGLVAAEFNRYAAKPIDIETPGLRDLAVTGVFASDDMDSFVAFLRSLAGVRVEVTSTRIVVTQN
jgi:transmembrane sensor